jgi:tripartite ATP-independent transporter DctM subunit
MSALGLGLLLAVAILIPLTGLPAFLILLFAAMIGALAGIASGTIPVELLAALPSRLTNLLENDLLQALPLYVLVGGLMNRLRVADALFETTVRVLRGRREAPALAGFALGALLGPMNGSVGASVVALSRTVAPKLAASGMTTPSRHALVAVASTLGVVVPPSLVLILLGDGMMAAHTIASRATNGTERIVNTQDVFRGALVPAGLFVFLCLLVAIWESRAMRRADVVPANRAPSRDAFVAIGAIAFVVGLLAGVATGRFYAVEGAAAGAFVLFVAALASGALRRGALRSLLVDVMTTTGALFALLIAATTFTLVFRTLGTDKLVESWIVTAPLTPVQLTALVLAAIGLSAIALDAFEIIFVLVPVLMPPLLMRVPDASWVAVLVLLALQGSFLLPPAGYALLLTRGVLREHVSARAMARHIAPYLAAQMAVLLSVLAFPALVHLGQPAEASSDASAAPASQEEMNRRMEEMLPEQPGPDDGNADGSRPSGSAEPPSRPAEGTRP